MSDLARKTPVHLWIIGILAVLWNAVGAFDYSATQLRLDAYMSQFTEEQLDYFYGFPAWVDGAWAIAVWCALFGSFGLLFRQGWSVAMFGASILGMLVTALYNFAFSDGIAVMGEEALAFTALIWVIAIALFFYASAMKRRGVLGRAD